MSVAGRAIGSRSAGQQLDLELGDDRLRDLVLDQEDVGQIAVISLGPKMTAVPAVDQLGRDANSRPRLSNAAFEDIAHAQFPCDWSIRIVRP